MSDSAVRRLVQRLEATVSAGGPAVADVFVRVEGAPGSEAQVDFGDAGLTVDPATGATRKTWVFVLVLSWSRHLYAALVFDQQVETCLLCHRHAFEACGGVPARVVPDHLKAAIVQASFHDPVVQRSYRECAREAGSTTGASLTPTRRAPPGSRARSNRGACTTSSATSWPAARHRSQWTS
ncbi:MAG: transposase [Chloroflexi bacterium]|nr:transposase [Chloroflexota bacterium]